MDKLNVSELIGLYEKWITIVESQLILLRDERLDESFEQLLLLEAEKRHTRLMVMNHNSSYDQLEAAAKTRLTQAIQTLLSLNGQAEPYLQAWYDEAANDMKQVTTQQRILTSYGGTQSSDIVSIYVDSKK